jgi:ATP-dependent DNA helicase DinG
VQGTAPRNLLLEQFRESGNGVLLGAASFWEGVDVAGEALSVVVIDRLPFAAPDDPVPGGAPGSGAPRRRQPLPRRAVAAGGDRAQAGRGRLIRSFEDRGVLVLCDPAPARQGLRPHVPRQACRRLPRTRELADVQRFFGPRCRAAEPGEARTCRRREDVYSWRPRARRRRGEACSR